MRGDRQRSDSSFIQFTDPPAAPAAGVALTGRQAELPIAQHWQQWREQKKGILKNPTRVLGTESNVDQLD